MTGSLRLSALLLLLLSRWASADLETGEDDFVRSWVIIEEQLVPPSRDELLASGDGSGMGGGRRITPKSIFVAPSFNKCSEGYRPDSMGRCIKVMKLNPAAQWEAFLKQLNLNMNKPTAAAIEGFSTTTNAPELLHKTDSTGPFQLNIPLYNQTMEPEEPETTTSTVSTTVSTTVSSAPVQKQTTQQQMFKSQTTPKDVEDTTPMDLFTVTTESKKKQFDSKITTTDSPLTSTIITTDTDTGTTSTEVTTEGEDDNDYTTVTTTVDVSKTKVNKMTTTTQPITTLISSIRSTILPSTTTTSTITPTDTTEPLTEYYDESMGPDCTAPDAYRFAECASQFYHPSPSLVVLAPPPPAKRPVVSSTPPTPSAPIQAISHVNVVRFPDGPGGELVNNNEERDSTADHTSNLVRFPGVPYKTINKMYESSRHPTWWPSEWADHHQQQQRRDDVVIRNGGVPLWEFGSRLPRTTTDSTSWFHRFF